ncbi:MAG: AAA family ATPase [Veillonella sp.]|uniref:AAA family ATPase n=1 Tax=Veillonella sp. TaxID=1926307 RepID=UPI001ECE4225|nr:AAA family ATPase [Veillonella sp.]MBS6293193.1 AAA family ATPase [Veillonella sp.]
MITEIQNLTLKSFKNYSTPQNFFKTKNIIFGYNGRGKSSLAEGIISAYLRQDNDNLSYRYFNRNYVRERLLLNDEDSVINGVKVSFSENDADIANKIAELKSKIRDVSALSDKINTDRNNIRIQINTIHDEKKGNARINQKQSRLTVEEVLELYKNDLEEALKINTSKVYIKSFDADSKGLEEDQVKINSLSLPKLKIEILSDNEKTFLFKTLNTEYKLTEDIPTYDIIKWLEAGIPLHDESDVTCKFCHGNFKLQDVKDRIKAYQENNIQKDINALVAIKDKLSRNLDLIEKAKLVKENLTYINLDSNIIDELSTEDSVAALYHIVKYIDSKILDMSKIFSIDDVVSDFEQVVSDKDSTIKCAYNKKVTEIEAAINNIEKLAKGCIAIAIEESDISEKLKSIHNDEQAIKKIKDENQKIKEEIAKLEASQSEYSDFMEFLNEILESLGIHFKLNLVGDNYCLKHIREEVTLSINDISEGEKNLLALLYFYFELYNDNQQKEFKNVIRLIVIDDPISSLDDSNKFYVLEVVKKLLTENNSQVFVLTHSWDDFCQLSYGIKSDNEQIKLFEVYKKEVNDFSSSVRPCKCNISPYKKLFSEIYELSNKSIEDLSDCDIYHAANSMRKVFEEFLNFKKVNLLPQKSNQSVIEEIYRNATGQELGNNRKCKLGVLLTFINVLSHRALRSNEIIENSKFLMKLIEDIDKVHFNEMKHMN